MPRSTSHESNGPATAPIAFWWKATCSASSLVGDARARRRRRRSARRGTSSSSARRRRRRAAIGCWRYGDAKVLSTTSSAPASWATLGERGDVGDAEQRVGRRLDPDDLRRARPDRGADGVDVVPAGRGVATAPTRSWTLREQPVGAAVRVARDDRVVAGPADGPQQGVLGRQPGREGQPAAAALERGQALLERGPRRVGAAAVLVAAAQPADAVLLVGRRLVDRRDHGAGERVGLLAGVDRERLEVHGHSVWRWSGVLRPG